MSNSTTINISSPAGSHKVFLQQDEDVRRTIHTWIDNVARPLTECSANSDGTALKGTTLIWIFHDVVSVSVDPASNSVAMDVSGANVDYSGVLNAGEAAGLVAFVKACKLPDLAA